MFVVAFMPRAGAAVIVVSAAALRVVRAGHIRRLRHAVRVFRMVGALRRTLLPALGMITSVLWCHDGCVWAIPACHARVARAMIRVTAC